MYRLFKTTLLNLIFVAIFCAESLFAQQPPKASVPTPAVATKPTVPTTTPPVQVTAPGATTAQPAPAKPVQTAPVVPAIAVSAPKVTAPLTSPTAALRTTAPVQAPKPTVSAPPVIAVRQPVPKPVSVQTIQPAAPAAEAKPAGSERATEPEESKGPAPEAELAAPEAPKPTVAGKEVAPGPSVTSEQFDTSKIKEYGGNWYLKRHWWEYAEGEYEKARQVLEQLFETRMAFFEKRNQLQRSLFEPFYRNMGFEQGELQDTLLYLIDQIEGARAQEGTLDIKQREFLSVLDEEKKTLEQLKLDMDQFSKFDDSINKALDLLMKQINQARQYEQTAWKEFKAIAEDLSDIKARERYYTIKTLYKDIKNISEYVRTDFKKYFDNLADVSHKEADRIKTTVQALKTRGIDLKEEAKKLAGGPSKAPAPSCDVKVQEQPGYFLSAVYWVGGVLKSSWNYVFGWIYRF